MAADRLTAIQAVVLATLEAHRRDPDQHDVWLPQVRCLCGWRDSSIRFRRHIAEEITDAILELGP